MMTSRFKMHGNARPVPVWLWFFALFAVSSFVGLLMYLDLYEKGRVSEHGVPELSSLFPGKDSAGKGDKAAATTVKKDSPSQDNSSTDKTPSFDFYSLLPKMEVLVPESEITTRIAKQQLKETPTETGSYYLQAGAFKDQQAADRMKAGLALLGIESKIVSVKLDSGVWHRVRVGPFNDSQKMDKVRSLMKANNISSIMVKVNS